jgi:hypothetical protein
LTARGHCARKSRPQRAARWKSRLSGAYTPGDKLIAYRSAEARAKGLREPENFTTHSTVKDPNERFAFKIPDVNGKLVSNNDPQFKDKVVLAIVTD